VREWYDLKSPARTLTDKVVRRYLRWHLRRMFAGDVQLPHRIARPAAPPRPDTGRVRQVAERLGAAERPLLLVGSQATQIAGEVAALAQAVERLGIPVYLSGMARGLLGRDHPLQFRHRRREALREADVVILAGVPCDFRLDYGRHIRRSAVYVSANRSRADLNRNRRPTIGVLGDAGLFLRQLAGLTPPAAGRWEAWLSQLRAREAARNAEIDGQLLAPAGHINPLYLCREIDRGLGPGAIVVADGGDFVGTAAYVVRPAGPLAWLDPGVFGTLGVGAGFALAAKLCRPEAEVWLLYGDGSAGYSLAEFDTFARHGLAVIAVVGNDARWSQIAREQVELLGDPVGTVLAHADYHRAAEGLGALGLRVDDPEQVPDTLEQARRAAAAGKPVLINAILGPTDFRKGSVSM
jgi:thiamine pyrophosphate-dependent acetolactate synthase large subunit-like protein